MRVRPAAREINQKLLGAANTGRSREIKARYPRGL